MTRSWLAVLQQPFFERLGWTLVHSVWEDAVIAALLMMTLAVLRRSASARYLAACAALTMALLVPIGTFFVIASKDIASPMAPATAMPASVIRIGMADAPARELSVSRLNLALPWAVIAWMGGVVLLSITHIGGWISVQRLRHHATPIDSPLCQHSVARLCERLGIDRAIEIAESTLVQVPVVLGWFRPMILLPGSALTGLSVEHLESLLAHELAHIRRHDYLVNLVQTVVETLLFYHPAVWWISRVIRQERENCCDDLAVRAIGSAQAYGQALAAMEELRGLPSQFALAATGGSLLLRIQRLLKPPQQRVTTPWPILLALVVVIVMAACAQMKSGPLASREQQDKLSKSAPTTSPIALDPSWKDRPSGWTRRPGWPITLDPGIPSPTGIGQFSGPVLYLHDSPSFVGGTDSDRGNPGRLQLVSTQAAPVDPSTAPEGLERQQQLAKMTELWRQFVAAQIDRLKAESQYGPNHQQVIDARAKERQLFEMHQQAVQQFTHVAPATMPTTPDILRLNVIMDQLTDAQLKAIQVQSIYGQDNPTVKALQREVEELQGLFDDQMILISRQGGTPLPEAQTQPAP